MTKVKAIQRGFLGGQIREIGDVFDVKEGVTGDWFEPVEPTKKALKTPAKTVKK